MTPPDHRACCPWAYPPADWQARYPGESWHEWHHRTYGVPYLNLISLCCGWPMVNYACLNPEHPR